MADSLATDPSLQRNTEVLVGALKHVDRASTSIRRSTAKLITRDDIQRERNRVKTLIDETAQTHIPQIHDSLKFFQRYLKLHKQFTKGLKLIEEAKSTLDAFEDCSALFYAKCCEVDTKLSSSGVGSSTTSRSSTSGTSSAQTGSKRRRGRRDVYRMEEGEDDADNVHEEQELLSREQQQQVLDQRESFERRLHDEIMDERNKEVLEIAESVKDIHDIFQHIHELVGEQGEKLDEVEEDLQKTEASTRQAADQLRLAKEAADKSTQHRILIILLVVLFLGAIIYVMLA